MNSVPIAGLIVIVIGIVIMIIGYPIYKISNSKRVALLVVVLEFFGIGLIVVGLWIIAASYSPAGGNATVTSMTSTRT